MLETLFKEGFVAEIILLALALEAGLIIGLRSRWPGPIAEWLWLLAAGAGLAWALRMALRDEVGPSLAVGLAIALACHSMQLYYRIRKGVSGR